MFLFVPAFPPSYHNQVQGSVLHALVKALFLNEQGKCLGPLLLLEEGFCFYSQPQVLLLLTSGFLSPSASVLSTSCLCLACLPSPPSAPVLPTSAGRPFMVQETSLMSTLCCWPLHSAFHMLRSSIKLLLWPALAQGSGAAACPTGRPQHRVVMLRVFCGLVVFFLKEEIGYKTCREQTWWYTPAPAFSSLCPVSHCLGLGVLWRKPHSCSIAKVMAFCKSPLHGPWSSGIAFLCFTHRAPEAKV